jgi:trans-aconitate 2-methyltransferase
VADVNERPGDPYPFGDSDRAIERLDILARLFAPATVALLDRAGTVDVHLAGDLGCGPGHTTELIARHCRPGELVAIDSSPAMAAAAARRLKDVTGAGVLIADVGELPISGFDLLHARYLLAHLSEPRAALDGWAAHLRPQGRLLIDEIDHIDTTVEPFARYLDLVTAMMAARGTDLFIGRALAGHRPAGVETVDERLLPLPQPTPAVARMFSLNLDVWRHGPWAAGETTPAALDGLAAALAELAATGTDTMGEITWTHRQIIWERRP